MGGFVLGDQVYRARHGVIYEAIGARKEPLLVKKVGVSSDLACLEDMGVAFDIQDDHALFEGQRLPKGFSHLSCFFPLAISLAQCVAKMHERGLLHLELCVQVFGFKDSEAFLLDTGCGKKFYEGEVEALVPEAGESLDERADLYSLGLCFYQMIHGALPFVSENREEMMRWHRVRQPTPLLHVVREIPEMLSLLVDKLLSKRVEDRYQTIQGVLHDLELCQRSFQESDPTPFALGSHDVPDRLRFPSRVYGRDHIVDMLMKTLDAVPCSNPTWVLLLGAFGLGKSFLVHQLRRQSDVFFVVSGRQALRGEPLGAMRRLGEHLGFCGRGNFGALVRKKLEELGEKHKKVVVVFDRLEWIDASSIEALVEMIPSTSSGLFIGCCQKTDLVNPWIDKVKREGSDVITIPLKPWSLEDTEAMVRDTLCRKDVGGLGRYLHSQARGNPYEVKCLLCVGKSQGWIYRTSLGWEWDVPFTQKALSEGEVQQWMRQHIEQSAIRDLLEAAAIYGEPFTVEEMACLLDTELDRASEKVREGLELGFFTKGYRFVDERVEEMVLNFCTESRRAQWHMKIVHSLPHLSRMQTLRHLNASIPVLRDPQELALVYLRNMEEASHALDLKAYHEARGFLRIAREVLPPTQDTFDLDILEAKVGFVEGDHAFATARFDQILEQMKEPARRADVYVLLIELYSLNKEWDACVEALQEGLLVYSSSFKHSITSRYVWWQGSWVWWRYGMFRFASMRPMTHPKALGILRLIRPALFAIFHKKHHQKMLYFVHLGFLTHLKYGYTDHLMTYVMGAFLMMSRGQSVYAEKILEEAQWLYQKNGGAQDWVCVLATRGMFLEPFLFPFQKSRASFQEAIALCREKPCGESVGFASIGEVLLDFRCGESLDRLMQQIEHKRSESVAPGFFAHRLLLVLHALFARLHKKASHDRFLEQSMEEQRLVDPEDLLMDYYYEGLLCFYYYFVEEYEMSFKYALKIYKRDRAQHLPLLCDHFLFFCYFAFSQQEKYREEMRQIEKMLHKLAQQNPANFYPLYVFIEGHEAFVQNRVSKSIRLYQEGCQLCTEKGWTLYLAFGLERLGQLHLTLQKDQLAKFYLQEANRTYMEWGALQKVACMHQAHPQVFQTTQDLSVQKTSEQMMTSNPRFFDFFSVMKGTQNLAQQSEVENLLRGVLQIFLESTGGQRVVFLRLRGSELYLEGQGCLEQSGFTFALEPREVRSSRSLPLSVLQYVMRSGDTVVSHHDHVLSKKDPYLRAHHVQAICCFPVHVGEDMAGCVYVEHRSNRDALEITHKDAIILLASQVMIALQNAQLYADTRRFIPQGFLKMFDAESIIDLQGGDHMETQASLLVADVRQFTSLAHKLSSERVFAFVQEFLQVVSPLVATHQGFIDRYVGDSLIAVFSRADDALMCAEQMQLHTKLLSIQRRKREGVGIELGIALHSGPVVLGIVGDCNRLEGTVFGETVAVAMWIENLNKKYGTQVLVSQELFQSLQTPQEHTLVLVDSCCLKAEQSARALYTLGREVL